jgi:glycosyltransferase involved in cell wall biosynthesis
VSGILALVPGYNEERGIARVVEGVKPHLPLLVVDDGSKDATADRAEAAGARVHRQIPNQGKGAALRAGFRIALEEGYDAVLTLDADGQHAPAEIPRFVECFGKTQAELIIGARDFSRMPLVRKLSNQFARATFSWAVGRSIQDNQSGYRLIARPLLELLARSDEGGFEFEVEMIATCIREDMRLEWVPISTIYADEKSHIDPVAHTVNFLRILKKARGIVRG